VTSLLDDISADGSYTLHLGPHDQLVWSSGEPGAETFWQGSGDHAWAQRFLLRMVAPFAPRKCCNA
jgi:hypothetical protein